MVLWNDCGNRITYPKVLLGSNSTYATGILNPLILGSLLYCCIPKRGAIINSSQTHNKRISLLCSVLYVRMKK